MSSAVRGTSLRAGGACVRCRKGKTKCVYENNRAPCKNCAKGMHECYLPSESLAHHHGQSPARVPRPRESLPGERSVSTATHDRPAAASQPLASRTVTSNNDNIVNALLTIGARSSAHLTRRYGGQGGATAAAEHFAVKTISTIMQNLDNPLVVDIQALCLLIIHEWGSRNAIRAYVYLGQAARMAQMHRIVSAHYNPKPEAEQFIKDESFRRTLWLIYILDCFLTSSPGRLPALTALDIKDMALPCPDMSFSFGSPVFVRTLSGQAPRDMPDPTTSLTEVGEFGHIVMATQAWRNVVEMLTTVEVETFSEQQCVTLDKEIEAVRQGLPMHFMDKAGHINLHITMGSGYTYAMLHCLLHCATIMVNRRRLLQYIRTEGFTEEAWRNAPHTQLQAVDRAFASAHAIVSLLLALDSETSKDGLVVFPLEMLFTCFEAGATVAWFSLKGLTPVNANETSRALVRDAMHFLQEGTDYWTLSIPWYRHLSVMAKVLRNGGHYQPQPMKMEPSPAPKDDLNSQPDSNPDAMDYERPPPAAQDQSQGRESEPPRTSGFAAINGASLVNTPATASPPPAAPAAPKAESTGAPSSAGDTPVEQVPQERTANDMTATELCEAFENQLLELDDLAAFMGGGV
ncbi:hypothetical protein TruAng_010934 [Truncatella angustata]|nr:hypothetical protein TruAng_010934 [Truncatella angustata]